MRFVLNNLAKNFRNIGGLTSYDGKKIKTGLLFRSALITDPSAEEQKIINSLGIKTIIDLRQPSSLLKKKYFPIEGAEITNMPFHECDNTKPFPKKLIEQAKINDHGLSMEERTYKSIFLNDYSITQFKNIFGIIQSAKNPLLIHCALGKDRTGIVFFLLEHALGIKEDEIINDYLLSNISTYCKISKKIEENIDDFDCNYDLMESSFEIYLAKKGYYDASINTILEKYGTIEFFLTHILDVDVELLRKKYLE